MVPASDGSKVISDKAVISMEPSGGVYPIEYTLYYRGTYVMSVTGLDGQVIH